MELKQNLVRRNYKKCEAKNQITIGEDYSVPDGKPDIASILQKRAEVQVEEVHTEKGKIKISGNLNVRVLYLAERSSDLVNSLNIDIPFDEILYMDEVSTGDHLKVDWTIEELKVSIVHPGKINIRAIVLLLGEVMAFESFMLTEAAADEQIAMKQEMLYLAEPVIDRKDSYRIREEMSLATGKPNVETILWRDLQVCGLDIRMQEGRIEVKGEVHVLVLYRGEEGEHIQWAEQTLPFQGVVPVDGLSSEMFGILNTEITHKNLEVKPDYDGELRTFLIELSIEIQMQLYEEKKMTLLADAYSTQKQTKLQKKEIRCEKLRMCNQSICRIEAQEKLSGDTKILQLIGHQETLQNKSCQMNEQGILCEGILEIQTLYVTGDDKKPLQAGNLQLPFKQQIEICGMEKEDRWNVTGKIERVQITPVNGEEVEVRAVLQFHACVMQQYEIDNIEDILMQPNDMEECKKRPAACVHFVQRGETLWEIAKKNSVTMEEIQRINELQSEEITPGKKLILLKTVPEQVLHLS